MNCCGTGSQKEPKQSNAPASKEIKNGAGVAKSSLILGLALVLIAGMSVGYFIKPSAPSGDHLVAIKSQNIDEQRNNWIAIGDGLKTALATQRKYDCCILRPCNECLYKEGECTCRQDILNGEHPCGECIGEILEGHGLAELKPYYAKAIAHKVGAEHEAHLEEIIEDMYPEVQ